LDQKILGVLLLELQLIVTNISEYFHAIFCSKVESSMLMLHKTTQKVFHWWPLNPG